MKPNDQKGVGILVVVGVVAVVLLGAIVVTSPQIRDFMFPDQYQPTPDSSPQASGEIQYSSKQQLYIRNKEVIKKNLNLTEEQFNLLVESADKN